MNMHELGMNRAWTGHELCMKLLWLWGLKAWNMGQNSKISWVLLGKNLLCFEHEHGHAHAQEPWTIFVWVNHFVFKSHFSNVNIVLSYKFEPNVIGKFFLKNVFFFFFQILVTSLCSRNENENVAAIYLFTYFYCIYLFIYLFNYLFIYLFIYLFLFILFYLFFKFFSPFPWYIVVLSVYRYG